jgi:hypothetical protein
MAGYPRTPWWRRGWDGEKTPGPVSCRPCFLVWPAVGRGQVEVGRRWMDKAESREFRGTTLVVFSLEGDQWRNSARYGTHSDRFSPPFPGWTVKSEIWHWYCFHAGCCCSHEGRKWLAVTLNALTFVSELVSEVGRSARPRVVRVGDFSVVEVFRQASLVRVGTWSRRPIERVSCESERGRGVSFVVLARPVSVGWVFGVVFSEVCFSWSLIVGTPCFGTRHNITVKL